MLGNLPPYLSTVQFGVTLTSLGHGLGGRAGLRFAHRAHPAAAPSPTSGASSRSGAHPGLHRRLRDHHHPPPGHRRAGPEEPGAAAHRVGGAGRVRADAGHLPGHLPGGARHQLDGLARSPGCSGSRPRAPRRARSTPRSWRCSSTARPGLATSPPSVPSCWPARSSMSEKTARQVLVPRSAGQVHRSRRAAGAQHRRGPRRGSHLDAGGPREPGPGRGRGEREGPVLPPGQRPAAQHRTGAAPGALRSGERHPRAAAHRVPEAPAAAGGRGGRARRNERHRHPRRPRGRGGGRRGGARPARLGGEDPARRTARAPRDDPAVGPGGQAGRALRRGPQRR